MVLISVNIPHVTLVQILSESEIKLPKTDKAKVFDIIPITLIKELRTVIVKLLTHVFSYIN